jgi:hypothetical protein
MLSIETWTSQAGYCCADVELCDSGAVEAVMTEVLEERRAFEDARAQARELVARQRARLGRACYQARTEQGTSRTKIGEAMHVGPQQVAEFEQAYLTWVDKHPGESLD